MSGKVKKKKKVIEDFHQNFWRDVSKNLMSELWLPTKSGLLEMRKELFPEEKSKELFNVESYILKQPNEYPQVSSLLSQFSKQDTKEKEEARTEEEQKELNKKIEKKRKSLENKNVSNIDELLNQVKLKSSPNFTFKTPFHPDKELKEELAKWFGCTRRVYNNGVAYLNSLIEKGAKKVNLSDMRAKCISEYKFMNKVQYDSKDIELQKAYSAFKNKRRKSKFLEFRSKKHMYRESFTIPSKHLKTKRGLYSNLIEKVCREMNEEGKNFVRKSSYPLIISKTITNKYFVSVPTFIPRVLPAEKQGQLKIVSIDPGTRTPFTCYDPSGVCFKVSDEKIDDLQKYSIRKDSINSKIKYLEMFRGERKDIKSEADMKVFCRVNRRINRMKKAFRRIQERITGLRDNFHYHMIKYLFSRYDFILIPEFNVKQMIQKTKKRKLRNEQARRLTLWSHYSFKQKLIHKAQFNGKKIIVTDEHFTTKTCGNCGQLNEVGSEKEFQCTNCKVNLDRDYNASRNILIRFLSKLTAPTPWV